jgi:Arabinose efflux permease
MTFIFVLRSDEKMIKRNYKNNIYLNRLYVVLTGFGITSLWVSYLLYKGMNLIEVGLLESVFHLTGFSFEIISGVLADKYGYKKILIIGRFCSLISAILIIVSNTFWGFAVAFVFSALSYNLNSGTNEALQFESLKELDQNDKYLSYTAKANFGFEISSAIGVFIAGILAKEFFEYTYYIAAIIAVVSIICVFFMKEPTSKQTNEMKVVQYFSESYHDLRETPRLLLIMLFFSSLDTIAAVFYHYFQDYLSVLGYSQLSMSVLIVIALGFQMIIAFQIEKITKRFDKRVMAVILVVMLSGSLLLAKNSSIISLAISFAILMMITTMSFILNNSYINEMIESTKRATMLSVSSMFYSIFMIVLFPVFGWLIMAVGYDLVFNLLIVFSCLLGVIVFKLI